MRKKDGEKDDEINRLRGGEGERERGEMNECKERGECQEEEEMRSFIRHQGYRSQWDRHLSRPNQGQTLNLDYS